MLLPKFTSASMVEEEEKGNRSTFTGQAISSSKKGTVVVGLKILIVKISQGKSNIVVKPAFKHHSSKCSQLQAVAAAGGSCCKSSPPSTTQYSCFLKSCFLCNKKLSLDKDVYMYRGDQGFCSIECRNRQIVLDDMSELESSTKKMVASYRNCSESDQRETQVLLQELRQRHHKPHNNDNQKIHWTIVS